MEKIGQATSTHKDLIEVQIKSIKSSEAFERGIKDTCVIVNGTIKLPPDFDEKELEDIILKWGKITQGKGTVHG